MYFAAATEPGTPGGPNEDWAGATQTAAVVLDGVTTFGGPAVSCRHGTSWYVSHLGARLLAGAAAPGLGLEAALANAIGAVAALHGGLCDLSDVAAPSAAVAMVRLGDSGAEYLVLSDVTVAVDHEAGISVATDDRVAATVSDLVAPGTAGSAVMERRRRYRNTEGGYWVAAADPAAAGHAVTGRFPLAAVHRIVLLTDGASRLVAPFGRLGWGSLAALADESGPSAVIERVRSAEADDPECRRWPRFKVSDDATVAVLVPGTARRRARQRAR